MSSSGGGEIKSVDYKIKPITKTTPKIEGPQAVETRPQDFSRIFEAGGIAPLGGQATDGESLLSTPKPKRRAASKSLIGY